MMFPVGQMLGMALLLGIGAAMAEPISIESINELQRIGFDSSYPLDGNYVITQDIDAGPTADWDDGNGFRPIPGSFTGTLNGQGYVISDLTIDRPSENRVGLFENIDAEGLVKGLGLEGGAITGRYYVGGIAGLMNGVVHSCYSTNAVSGRTYVGGLAGDADSDGRVYSSYAAGPVDAPGENVGGLVGRHRYSTVVSRTHASFCSFWDIGATGQEQSKGGGVGVSTGQMRDQSTFEEVGWDLDSVWKVDSAADYPRLRAPMDPPESIPIATAEMLQAIGRARAYPLDGDYVVTQDIDASETVEWNEGEGFEPIGQPQWMGAYTRVMRGTFDGRGHVISGLTINRPNYHRPVGLFTVLNIDAVVRDVYLEDVNIQGRQLVGALAGLNLGEVSGCYATGYVEGEENVGGLIGHNQAVLRRSFTDGQVRGDTAVGGLVGTNAEDRILDFAATIRNSFSVADVHGNAKVGGLVGRNWKETMHHELPGSIAMSYAAGEVRSQKDGGGLVGAKAGDSKAKASFWDEEATGQSGSAGGKGLSTEAMMMRATFGDAGWDMTGVWDIDEGETYPYLVMDREESQEEGPVLELPDVQGEPQEEAEALVAEAGYDIDYVNEEYDTEFPRGTVIDMEVDSGNAVVLTISAGRKGDVNGNGEVTAVDIQLVINAVLGLDTPDKPHYRYVFGGEAKAHPDAKDIQIVINAVLGIE